MTLLWKTYQINQTIYIQIIDTIITFTNGILKSKSDKFKCIFDTNQIYTFKLLDIIDQVYHEDIVD